MHRSRMISHMYFFAFEHLQVDQAVYASKLDEEMKVWHYKQAMLRSPHRAERDQAVKIQTPFLICLE